LSARITSLRAQNRDVAKYEAELRSARLALPSTSGVSDFLRSLQALGNATLTNVSALTVGEPADVSTLAAPAPAAASGTAAASTAASSTPAAPGAPATGPAPGAVYSMAISAQVSGSPAALDRFLQQLQDVQPRAVLITSLTEGAGSAGVTTQGRSGGGATSLSLTMQAFVAPEIVPAAASPTPAAPPR
jgi:hypothetical protein